MKGRLAFRFAWLQEAMEDLLREVRELLRPGERLEAAVEIPIVWGGNYGTIALAGARAIVLAAVVRSKARFFEFHASKIKKAITGNGAAKKHEVAAVIKRLLGITEDLPLDATDAAGLAYFQANRSTLFEQSLDNEI